MLGQDTCRNRGSTKVGNHSMASRRQSAASIGGPPGAIPAATAGAVYLRRVLRSTPRLVASSFCDRPAYQWVKISITSITSKLLLANVHTPSLAAGHRGRSFWSSTGQTRDRHARRPHGELRDRRVGNYVIADPSNLGNFMIADNRRPPGRGGGPPGPRALGGRPGDRQGRQERGRDAGRAHLPVPHPGPLDRP